MDKHNLKSLVGSVVKSYDDMVTAIVLKVNVKKSTVYVAERWYDADVFYLLFRVIK